ncbi:MAG TPA: GAF domain-containing protein [Anaerolineales bacterium]|nr:GAF domain-containing protein [Anaerolineales bacterium]
MNEEAARWRQVLNLGEQLLQLFKQAPGVQAGAGLSDDRRALIAAVVERLFGAQMSLWLAGDSPVLRPPREGEDASRLAPWEQDVLLEQAKTDSVPPTHLMRQAAESGLRWCATAAGEIGMCGAAGCEQPVAIAAPRLGQDMESLLPGGENKPQATGVLQIARPDAAPFDEAELELFAGLTTQVNLAVQANRRAATERWRMEQLDLVRQVSARIAEIRSLEELSRQVTSLILETFDYYYVAVFTLEEKEDYLRFWASAGPRPSAPGPDGKHLPAEAVVEPEISVYVGQGLIGHVAETGREIVACDVAAEPRFRYSDALPETRSEVVLPLRVETRMLGVLDVQSDQSDDFTETDMLVLRALADSIALAIEDARLYSALRRRAAQLSAVTEVSQAITSILEEERLLDEVVTLIQKRFGYSYVHLFSVHTGRRKVFYEAGSDPRSQLLRAEQFAYGLDDPHGIIPWVARQGETILANDVAQEPRYRASSLPPDNTRSELSVPLIYGGEVLGVLDVQSDRAHAFNEDDRFLFEALADNIAVAMRNATLYRSERWRRQVADSLREVAGLLSADVGLDQVLDAVMAELERNLPIDAAAIWLLDAELEDDWTPALRLAAVHGALGSELAVDSAALDDWRPVYDRPEEQGRADDPFAWLRQALAADAPLLRKPDDPFEPLGAALDFPKDYSAIAAPLRVGAQRLGILTMAHRSAKRYGSESHAMALAFASYASVAIQNARLYEAAHEQAWVATVLLQVADATRSSTSLSDVLATVTRITPLLVGVRACVLYMWDDLSESFNPAAASGLSAEKRQEFERWRIAAGDAPAFDQARELRQTVALRGEKVHSDLPDLAFLDSGPDNDPDLEDEPPQKRWLIIIPLVSHTDFLGVLVIDYTDTDKAGANPDVIFDERLAILEGIAHQTAVAGENRRLVDAQKEEAYVSVALLQVAQAVVSLNDLNDILGAVVRITPILVGVRRSLLYLWDVQNQAFFLAQSYGVGRQAEEKHLLSPGEFPLLEAALERDQLAAIPLRSPSEAVENLEPPESWMQARAPSAEEVQVYLECEAPLVLAFPLTARGEVLGVLLVEEPDPLFAGGLSIERNLQRLREKRIEIVTGISQQVALAIQNDRLQLETVERERLAREFQLAREIQRTFLPQKLPNPPGWELGIRWRAAYEVSGDFYDLLELPGDRLGVVIADVADKGMPAALFMTLIRTLLRATVQSGTQSTGYKPGDNSEPPPPDEVLQRINDVMLADAPKEMYVTIFYGVLDLKTGQLTYANAGHNPPLCFSALAEEAQRLERSGMALGVLENSPMEVRRVTLAAGDLLVLYTDGVTEAFSPSGDMYAEGRLIEVLQGARQQPTIGVDEILDRVERDVCAFLVDCVMDDDLTLIAIRRQAGLQA